jgi:hypothetical protein
MDSHTPARATPSHAAKRKRSNYDEDTTEYSPSTNGRRRGSEPIFEIPHIDITDQIELSSKGRVLVQPLAVIGEPTAQEEKPKADEVGVEEIFSNMDFVLCDHGTVVELTALLRETPATKSQVLKVWPQHPNDRNYYHLALCMKSW